MIFSVTVGRGMQPFALQQLASKSCTINRITEGKISFDCDCLQILRELKCVERIFIEIASIDFEQMTTTKKVSELFDMLFASCNPLKVASAFDEVRKFQHLPLNHDDVNFRISIKVSGKWKRKIDCEKLSSSIARHLKRHFKWKSVLREAVVFELCIHISNGDLFVGVPLSRIPLSVRPYLLTNALRATVCDAMLSLAHIQEGMFIVDFTCGSSSILMQAAHDLSQKCFLLGCDIYGPSLRLSLSNRNHLEEFDQKKHIIELMAADVHFDFIRFDGIDRIISDLPFGQLYGCEEDALKILIRFLHIFSRCSAECEAVLLITAGHLPLVASQLNGTSRVQATYPLSLGTTQAVLLSLANS